MSDEKGSEKYEDYRQEHALPIKHSKGKAGKKEIKDARNGKMF